MESLFNDAEKRFILAEMIKISQLDVGILVSFIKAHGIRPDWLHMQLPGGRTLSQCLHAAESMLEVPMQPPPMVSPLKRKSLGDLDDYVSKRQAVESPGESSRHGIPPSPGVQHHSQPANVQPRPNGNSPAPLVPSISAAPYNPSLTGRRRGRPPKSVQNTWQLSYPPIAPSPPIPAVPQPHSPGVHAHPAHQGSVPGPSEQRLKKKALPEIAPRPTQGMPSLEPAVRSPAAPGADYQSWREETSRRDYYHVHSAEAAARERSFPSPYPQILPRPQSPHPRLPPVEPACPAAPTEPRRYGEPPPMAASELAKNAGQTSAGEPIKT
ncbi:uncharacterized protein B0T15DRAFT_514446 [Chaetomium strumarium]|uniref:Uncharacterized protein n=1 Tax=Chaetomium strumarium TaxID=1170767 RepID=A0AAJ0GLZ3_9PEZI|nr:hypothetical protein B0T15DRAFT_514446 [Chaetomium strumarium]